MILKEKVYINQLFGCSEFLQSLESFILQNSNLEYYFTGDYFSFGKDPIKVGHFLKKIIFNNSIQSHFVLGESDRELMIFADMMSETIYQRKAWMNPYSGTSRTLSCLGCCPWDFIKNRGKNIDSRLNNMVQELGWIEIFKKIDSSIVIPENIKSNFSFESSFLSGGSLRVLDQNSLLLFEIKNSKNDLKFDFLPWLKNEIFNQMQIVMTIAE